MCASQSVSCADPNTRCVAAAHNAPAQCPCLFVSPHGQAVVRRGRALLATGTRHDQVVSLPFGATWLSESDARASRFAVSALQSSGEGSTGNSKRGPMGSKRGSSVDEDDEDPDTLLEEEEEEEDTSVEDELAQKIEELEYKQSRGPVCMKSGMRAFECGEYQSAVKLFEECLECTPWATEKGGKAQIWLAMALFACGRVPECLELYRKLETSHPTPLIRKQATQLKFISEAPKLKINKDERVEIPDLSDLETPKFRPYLVRTPRKKIELSIEERALQNWSPKLPNKYVLVASSIVCLGLALYSAYLASQA
eukprot:CAMPEP_0198212876 /NCGR_PEP_ID=MMETSP1445-20131203/28094_1 /TAXON_ID=36898 /ORGANISM="Pyramimonas sp., Strain CCMP2087" /LENGTH=310 /DNA_ID=CAMNT_0043887435 /DNA_START=196 /DNA_END=1128 /DNA_ORIENTATION=+